MSYEADLYIMLPCIQKRGRNNPPKSEHKDGESFINVLKEISEYEFDNVLSSQIERCFLGKITLSCKNDDRKNPIFLGNQDAFITKSQYENTEFCLLSIVIVDVKIRMITYLLDQASREELIIVEEDREQRLNEWVNNTFGLKATGKAFFASCMSGLPDNEFEIRCIMSAEAFHNKEDSIFIVSSTIKKCLNKNHAQYTDGDVYISERGVIYVLKKFDEDYEKRLYTECLLIFIMELIILKITAINKAVIKTYTQINKSDTKDKVTSNEILRILEGFAKSLPMWDMHHFKYFLAQECANRVEDAFKVSRYFADYERNRTYLEQIVNTRKLIESEKETKVITIFTIIVSIIQIVPVLYKVASNIFNFNCELIKKEQFGESLVTFVVLIIALVLWGILGTRRIRRNRDEK
jgi:hypothetical protein